MKKQKVKDPEEITFRNALAHGDAATRCSAVIMGAGNFAHRQIGKGLMYLAVELLFFLYMAELGVGFLKGLVTLGTNKGGEVWNDAKQVYEYTSGDNSMLFLLYGTFTLFVIFFFVMVWADGLRSAYKSQIYAKHGRHLNTFAEDIRALFDGNLYKFLLSGPLVCIFAFTIVPLVFMALIAFTNYDQHHQPPGSLFHWVGLENFQAMLSSDNGLGYAFWHILG